MPVLALTLQRVNRRKLLHPAGANNVLLARLSPTPQRLAVSLLLLPIWLPATRLGRILLGMVLIAYGLTRLTQ